MFLFRLLFVLLYLLPCSVLAQTKLSVQGSGKLYPIAIPQLCVRSGNLSDAQQVPKTMTRDLDLSGYFDVLNSNSFIEEPGKCGSPDSVAYSDWSVIGVEGLVKGVLQVDGRNALVQMYLHDVQQQRVVLAKEYTADISRVRSVAHRFANEILQYFTGVPGVFGSQIVYSGKTGRFKELFIMDMDGSNVKQLTSDRGLAVSASFAPSGDEVIFTNYLRRQPDLFVYSLSSRKQRRVTNDIEMNFGAVFSKDSKSILFAKAVGKDSDIFAIPSGGGAQTAVTRGRGTIDVSPALSPDGSQMAFVSNRAGGPQIYIRPVAGGTARRVSFVTSNYCTSPAWAPKGDMIAFVCRADAGHQLFVAGIDGSNALQLTSYGSNEDPSWSPDGRYIVFATTFGKGSVFNLALIRKDGSNLRQLTNTRSGALDPTWSPIVP